jgi:tRNA dimethylallyltransferase
MPKHLVIVVGPTGIGKTSLGIKLARHYKTEIISADSRQLYKELKTGTAVPSQEELATVPHHFIQNKSIHDYYNASMYEFEALDLLAKLFQQHHLLVMVGGSGLYIDAVCKGIDDLPRVDPEIRNFFSKKYENEGLEAIQKELKEKDPEYYGKVDLNNHKRILKGLEISKQTGKPYSSFLTGKKKERNFNIVKIGLNTEREIVYDRINSRVDLMMEEGLPEEARSVYPYKHINALNTVGYKEMFAHFEGKISLEEATTKIKDNTRKYARKQLTWFKKDKETTWFAPGEHEKTIAFVDAQTG